MYQMADNTNELDFWEVYSYLKDCYNGSVNRDTPCIIDRELTVTRFNHFKDFIHERRLEFDLDMMMMALNDDGIRLLRQKFGCHLLISDIICKDGIMDPGFFIEYIASDIIDPPGEYFDIGTEEPFHMDDYERRKNWVLGFLHDELENYAESIPDQIRRTVQRMNFENMQLYESITFIEDEIDHCAKRP